jgi:hypothetical protein
MMPNTRCGSASKIKRRERDVVTANVHQPTAAMSARLRMFRSSALKYEKERLDRAQFADAACLDDLFGPLPLRMQAVHERLHYFKLRMLL